MKYSPQEISNSPILRGIGYAGEKFHRFVITANVGEQSEEFLHEISSVDKFLIVLNDGRVLKTPVHMPILNTNTHTFLSTSSSKA